MNRKSLALAYFTCTLVLLLTSTVYAQEPATFRVSPAAIPAGRSRVVRIISEPRADLSKFEVEKPPEDSGVIFESAPELADEKKTIVIKISVDEDADEQVLPLTIVKKEAGVVTKRFTTDLAITEFRVRAIRKQAVPPDLEFAVDAMMQPLSYKATKDIFGTRVADGYYAIVVGLGNNTGFDLQVNKIGFITSIPILVPDRDKNGSPVLAKKEDLTVNGNLKAHYEFMEISAVDRPLVRSSIERDQSIGKRALALNLIGGVGTLTTGFLPFFHALGPRANFSSVSSILNGQLKDGFTQSVPDFTLRHLNRLDNELIMDQDFLLPNNSERNTVVFIPRNTLQLGKEFTKDKKDHRDNLRMVTERLGRLVVVGRQIDRFANRQIVVRSGMSGEAARPSTNTGRGTMETPAAPAAPVVPVTIESVSPNLGTLSEAKEIIITGTGFIKGEPVKVMFGDRQTTGAATSATTVQATVPPVVTARSIAIKVIVDATRSATKADAYTYIDELSVTSFEPSNGPIAGGTVVRINGRGFQTGASVTFDNVAATNVSVSNDHNVITATAPAHAAGIVTVTVKNTNGKSFPFANAYTYVP